MSWLKSLWCALFHVGYHVIDAYGGVFYMRCDKCKHQWEEIEF